MNIVVTPTAPSSEADSNHSASDVVSGGAIPTAEAGSASASIQADREQPASSTSAGGLPGSAPAKRSYPPAAEVPTQQAERGIQFDFNDGCRIVLPEANHPWRVRLSDLDTGNILFETELKSGSVRSTKRYYVRFRLEVWQHGESVFAHDYSARDREVLVQFPTGTLGDSVGWFSYAVKFKEKHGCRLTCAMAERLIPLFREGYPDITLLTHEQIKPERFYATYSMGLFFDDKDFRFQPCDFRHVGLHRTAGYILGVDPTEMPPRIVIPDSSRPIDEPYVVIATQSTTQAKYWNNPTGWYEIVSFLKEVGYRVICIDQKRVHGTGLVWNHIPHGCEDETGDRPLLERVRWIKHADFFVGLASGLSWLAWCTGTPVVMISGFSHPLTEFYTPYRIINYHVCNSCWDDPKHRFDHSDFLWCPRHKGTPRQFECTRAITPDHVKATIKRIPAFAACQAARSVAASVAPVAKRKQAKS